MHTETLKIYRILVILIVFCLFLSNFLVLAPLAHAQQAGDQIYWGATIKGVTYGLPDPVSDMRAVDAFESNAGKKVSIIQYGQGWFYNGVPIPAPIQTFENYRQHGSIPYYSWASRDSSQSSTNSPDFRSSVIASGKHDAYIKKFATDVKNWGHPLFLRLDWEMDGWWYPWGEGKTGTNTIVNGNNPGDYIKMWRHVHDIFDQVGATNVTWVWCVNLRTASSSFGSPAALSQIYPGDAYVDWTGFDPYNRTSGWIDFNTMITGTGTTWLRNSYQDLLDVAPSKPIMIGEIGSKEDPIDPQRKANWLLDGFLTQLPINFPKVKAVVYFDWNTTNDPANPDATVAIESSPQSKAAFAKAISSSYYSTNTFTNLPLGKIQPIQTNMLLDPSFEQTGTSWLSPWYLTVKPGASGTILQDRLTPKDGTQSAKITTPITGGVYWYVNLGQGNLTFNLNKTYTISYWAKASTPRTTHVIIQQNYSPYTAYFNQASNITTTWQKYTLSFPSHVTDTNTRFSFTAADSTGDFWVDGVSILTN